MKISSVTIWFACIWIGGLSAGCASSRMNMNVRSWNERRADYIDYFDYYFWGFKGHPTVDLQKVCMDQVPYAAEQVRTVEDGIITAFTLGIYAPMTVRVWCGD